MTGQDAGGWFPLPPDFSESHPTVIPSTEEQQGLDESADVAALGAVCDLQYASGDGRTVSFAVSEFVELGSGARVVLRGDLGFTIGWGSSVSTPSAVWDSYTEESITRDVLNVVLPDDDDSGEDHPWEWLAELARERGLSVTAEHLRNLPYRVELTDRVLRLISAA